MREKPSSTSLYQTNAGIGAVQFVLLLHSVPKIGEKTLTRLLRQIAADRLDPHDFLALSASELRRRHELAPACAVYLAENKEALIAQSAELARTVRAHHLHFVTVEGAVYPARLERNDDAPPPILYAHGNFSLLNERAARREIGTAFTFAIATSNGSSQAELARQDALATELLAAGGIPLTGHDRAAYQRVALAAQRTSRPTIYVFDRGLREALGAGFDRPPFPAARIRAAAFDPLCDLAVSPFRLDDHGMGANMRRRDRLIFALSDIIIAADVRDGGVMVEECKRAHGQGQTVYVDSGGRDGNESLRAFGIPALPAEADWVEQVVSCRQS